jgi:hypothetical protein
MHKQGSDEWKQERLGKITASRFRDVTTQPRSKADQKAGKLSKTAESYLLEVAAEIVTGQADDRPPTWAMKWGSDNEAGARDVYEQLTGQSVQQVGLLIHPDVPELAGSPDGLIGEDGGLEIKCPANTREHLATVVSGEIPAEYVPQVHGHLLITGREWWDYVSYDPRVPDIGLALWRKRVVAAEIGEELKNLAAALLAFRIKLHGLLKKLEDQKEIKE